MRILRADAMGFCFGVRDALDLTKKLRRPEDVTIHGELVHNERVLKGLRDRGFELADERDRESLKDRPYVMVTAHGISDRERRRLESAGKELIDTTCPLVARVHDRARMLRRQGYFVVVIGKPGHVEVRGIVEDLERYVVVRTAADVGAYPHARIGVVCQTTAVSGDVRRIRRALAERNPDAEIRFFDTVCKPTRDRQEALEQLLDVVDAMVVVGGKNSNNTRRLAARSRERGIDAVHVQAAADLDPAWFDGRRSVGLTAGTSTPDGTIEEVHRALLAIAARTHARAI